MRYSFQYAYSWRGIETPEGLGKGTFEAQHDEEAKQVADMLQGSMIFVSVMRGTSFIVSVWNTKKVADKLRSLTDMRGKAASYSSHNPSSERQK
ncbi:hypothetical protein MUP07_00645 [Candidatus Bathyarchaeota archaeon]|nr:hypothetical protein [Candidatus Bathyarchaeota archaeon]